MIDPRRRESYVGLMITFEIRKGFNKGRPICIKVFYGIQSILYEKTGE